MNETNQRRGCTCEGEYCVYEDGDCPLCQYQYPRGTTRSSAPEKPPESIVDPDGDTWLWTDGDKQGTPGYQFAGGSTMQRAQFGVGPAHTREYVELGGYKVSAQRNRRRQ